MAGVSIKLSSATFSNSNIIGSLKNRLRFTIPSGTETANGNGWNYTNCNYANTSNYKLASGVDGYFDVKMVGTAASGSILLVSSDNVATSYSHANCKVGVFPENASGHYKVVEAGTGGTANVVGTRAFVSGDMMRLNRVGSAWSAQISSDNGVTWTTIHNYITTYSGDAYPALDMIYPDTTMTFTLPSGSPSTT